MVRLNEARIETEKDLAFLVTQGIWNGTLQSIIDVLGHENAFHTLDKRIHHNAKWIVTMAVQTAGRDADGVYGLLNLLHWYLDLCYRMDYSYGTNEEGNLDIIGTGCRAAGIYPSICEWFCRREFIFICEESNPELALELHESLAKGDGLCRWVIHRKDGKELMESPISYRDIDLPQEKVETMDYYAIAGAGEFFTQSTASLVASIGAEKALGLLLKSSTRFGEEFGTYIAGKSELWKIETPLEMVQFIDKLFQIKGNINRNDGSWECAIDECPYRDSPVECCKQIESFRIASIKTIFPDLAFTFQEERGEKGCRWSLKGDVRKDRPPENNGNEHQGPMERLMTKLVEGEITEEEYERKMALLKKHMPSR